MAGSVTEPQSPPVAQRSGRSLAGGVLIGGCIVLYVIVLARTAWLCDDSYITFRTVDNFLHGYGLTWNPGERVQAYTHPLWMFLLAGLTWTTGTVYYSAIFGSMALSLGAVLIYVLAIARGLPQAVLGLVILLFSKAFIDYSTSGLENPLSYLLVSLFLWHYLRQAQAEAADGATALGGRDARADNFSAVGPRGHQDAGSPARQASRGKAGRSPMLLLSLWAGLLALTRMDLLLLVAPALAHSWWRTWRVACGGHGARRRALPASLAPVMPGFLLLIGWEVFSIIYYGFPFPNTAYAKLHTGLPAGELIVQGLHYFLNSLRIDPLTLPAIAAGIAVAVIFRPPRGLAVAGGIVLYLLYVVRIGGDFMGGRYFAVPLLAAVAVLGSLELRNRPAQAAWTIAVAAAVLSGLCGPLPPVRSDSRYDLNWSTSLDPRGVADERAYYYQATGLLRRRPRGDRPDNPQVRMGLDAARAGPQVIASPTGIGMFGYFAGPRVHIVDGLALADPLLARLPMIDNPLWRIGHFWRSLPDGYTEGLRSGRNELSDVSLRPFYDRIRLITTGPVFRRDRWQAILDVNLGRGKGLMDTDEYRHPPRRVRAEAPAPGEGRFLAVLEMMLDSAGAWICFEPCRASRLEIETDGRGACRILYPQGADEPVEQAVPADPAEAEVRLVAIPLRVQERGFDRILIRPSAEGRRYFVKRVRILDPQAGKSSAEPASIP